MPNIRKARSSSAPALNSTHSKKRQEHPKTAAKTAATAPSKGWQTKAAGSRPTAANAKANQSAPPQRGSLLDAVSKALGNDVPTAQEKAKAGQWERAGLGSELTRQLDGAGLGSLSPQERAHLPEDIAPATLSVGGGTYERSKTKKFGGNTYELFTSRDDAQDSVVRVSGKGFTALVDSGIWGIQGEREFNHRPPLAINAPLMKQRAAMGLDAASTVLTVSEAFAAP